MKNCTCAVNLTFVYLLYIRFTFQAHTELYEIAFIYSHTVKSVIEVELYSLPIYGFET